MRLALTALAASALTPGAASAQSVQVGIAAAIVGDVSISNAAAAKERKIARKQRVSWGDTIRTMKKSELHILLLDRSNFTIGSSTRMTIDRFVYDPSEGRSLVARVIEGAFRFMSGSKNDRNSATIESPVGTIGIRGTALDGVIGEDAARIAKDEPFIGKGVKSDKHTATLVVLRGPGQATEGGLSVGIAEVTAAGKTVTLDAPEFAAYIPRPGAQPIGPFRLSAAGLSQVQDLLSPAVARAAKGNNTLGKILAGAAVLGAAAIILTDGDKDDPPSGQSPQRNPDTRQTPQDQPKTPTRPVN
jgi:hypothetical protein